jgi:hypothetical protein
MCLRKHAEQCADDPSDIIGESLSDSCDSDYSVLQLTTQQSELKWYSTLLWLPCIWRILQAVLADRWFWSGQA